MYYGAPVAEAGSYLPPAGGTQSLPSPAGPQPPRRGRRTTLAACAALAIVAAGAIGGFAIVHFNRSSPSAGTPAKQRTGHATRPASIRSSPAVSPPPAGYQWYSLSAASAGTAGGFRVAVPADWVTSRSGLVTYARNPANSAYMEVDLTQHTVTGDMAEAHWLQSHTIHQGKVPGYRRISLRPVDVLGTTGAVWTFSFSEPGVGRMVAQDYLFNLPAGGGSQSYAVYASAPLASWPQTAQALAEAMQTFQPQT